MKKNEDFSYLFSYGTNFPDTIHFLSLGAEKMKMKILTKIPGVKKGQDKSCLGFVTTSQGRNSWQNLSSHSLPYKPLKALAVVLHLKASFQIQCLGLFSFEWWWCSQMSDVTWITTK
jgi:hypothetical protein